MVLAIKEGGSPKTSINNVIFGSQCVQSSVIGSLQLSWALEPIPADIGQRQSSHMTGRQSISGHIQRQTTIHAHIHTYEQFRVQLTCMSLDCVRKLENPEVTHADTGRTCKLHTEGPPRPVTLLMWGDTASHYTTVQPLDKHIYNILYVCMFVCAGMYVICICVYIYIYILVLWKITR